MAEGRFLSKSIARDWELNHVSLEADYLFTRCVPHLDREGRVTGHPGELKAMVVPVREEMTVEVIDRCLAELADAELVLWYEVDGRPALWFKGFVGNQKNARLEREAVSKLPPQNHPALQRISTFVRPLSGNGRKRSAEGKLSQEKLREEKLERPVVPESLVASAVEVDPSPPTGTAEQLDGLTRNGEPPRERAAAIIRTLFHLGRDGVRLGHHRETLEIALARWDRAVKAGADPHELNAELELVRVVEQFAPDEPITTAVYFGRKRQETRELCKHERIKREPAVPIPHLPPVDVDPPPSHVIENVEEKKRIARRQLAALRSAAKVGA